MKIIVSHDIDHLSVFEHYKDLIIPKLVVRSFFEKAKGFISGEELKGRIFSLFSNKLNNLEELMQFDKDHNVPSTFFVGVENGLGLSYSLKNAQKWICRIEENGFDVGVHGIHFDNFTKITDEKKRFGEIVKTQHYGIRMHYLRMGEQTGEYLAKAGYLFDSSEYAFKNPYKVGKMWEFPLHVMDTYLLTEKGLQSFDQDTIKERTIALFNKAFNMKLKYFTLLFHDFYFSENYKTWKNWYQWFINWLKSQNSEFISFHDAIRELEKT